MKKNVFITLLIIAVSVSTVSAQSFLKKVGDAAKKVTGTEQKNESKPGSTSPDEYTGPVEFTPESTRIIGHLLLISGKMRASEDFRLMLSDVTIITPEGDTYKSVDMWWGGEILSTSGFDKNLTADINYSVDFAFDIKGKAIVSVTALTINAFNHTAQKRFKIALKDLTVPMPVDPILSNPSVVEIHKNVYLRWTKAEESPSGLKLNFVVENKGSKDVVMNFSDYNNAKIIDTEGTAYTGDLSFKGNVTFPSEVPVGGSITINKPVKVNQISLLEFQSRFFKYKVRKVVIPAN